MDHRLDRVRGTERPKRPQREPAIGALPAIHLDLHLVGEHDRCAVDRPDRRAAHLAPLPDRSAGDDLELCAQRLNLDLQRNRASAGIDPLRELARAVAQAHECGIADLDAFEIPLFEMPAHPIERVAIESSHGSEVGSPTTDSSRSTGAPGEDRDTAERDTAEGSCANRVHFDSWERPY
ncbi:MAG: hypothetical protein ABI948_11545 [Thermoleophilia bacterium]